MTLRLVHDPDTGCSPDGDAPDCPLFYWHHGMCKGTASVVLDERNAPPWCPLRAGDVVVTARKDGG